MVRQMDLSNLNVNFIPGQTICFSYKNWQGQVGTRTVQVIRLTYGATEWHPQPQWLLEALDIDKNAVRFFALCDVMPSK